MRVFINSDVSVLDSQSRHKLSVYRLERSVLHVESKMKGLVAAGLRNSSLFRQLEVKRDSLKERLAQM